MTARPAIKNRTCKRAPAIPCFIGRQHINGIPVRTARGEISSETRTLGQVNHLEDDGISADNLGVCARAESLHSGPRAARWIARSIVGIDSISIIYMSTVAGGCSSRPASRHPTKISIATVVTQVVL